MENGLTLSKLVEDWLKDNSEIYYFRDNKYHDIYSINCICHRSMRALSVIIDADLETRIFPMEDPSMEGDRESWVFLYATDPDYFPKLLENLNIAHAKRFLSETK